MKAYYLLPVLLLGTVAASCQHQEETAQVIPSPPAQVIVSPSASTVTERFPSGQITAPVGSPQALPSIATPPTFPTNAPPMQSAPVSSAEEVAGYLTWLRDFDAARYQESMQADSRLGVLIGNSSTVEIDEAQNRLREIYARYAAAVSQHQPPTDCKPLHDAYTAYSQKVTSVVQQMDFNHPAPPPKDRGQEEKQRAQSELRKLLAAYPAVPSFDIH